MTEMTKYGEIEFVDYISKDQEFNKDKAMTGWDNGLLTRNESRELIGLTPTSDGDSYKMKLSEFLVPQKDGKLDKSKVVEVVEIIESESDDLLIYDELPKKKL